MICIEKNEQHDVWNTTAMQNTNITGGWLGEENSVFDRLGKYKKKNFSQLYVIIERIFKRFVQG